MLFIVHCDTTIIRSLLNSFFFKKNYILFDLLNFITLLVIKYIIINIFLKKCHLIRKQC